MFKAARQRLTIHSGSLAAFLAIGVLCGPVQALGERYSPWYEGDRLVAPDADYSDANGASVALSGDLCAVGAPFEDGAGSNRGAVYLYKRSGTHWIFEGKVQSPNPADGAEFGYSVALQGETLVVGAWNDGGGSAYIFEPEPSIGLWVPRQRLIPTQPLNGGEHYGVSVAIDGDTILVGANVYYTGATPTGGEGAVFVFVSGDPDWTQQAMLTASDPMGGDTLGWALDIDGDRVLVGAPLASHSSSYAGRAYTFVRSGTAWSQEAVLTTNLIDAIDLFGFSVALDGDTALVGANKGWHAPPHLSEAGAAFVYERSGSSWNEVAELTASVPNHEGGFAWAVALRDGVALISDPIFTNPEPGVYVFERPATGWADANENTKLVRTIGISFGVSIDMDGRRAIVGAPDDVVGGFDHAGAAYIYSSLLSSASSAGGGYGTGPGLCRHP